MYLIHMKKGLGLSQYTSFSLLLRGVFHYIITVKNIPDKLRKSPAAKSPGNSLKKGRTFSKKTFSRKFTFIPFFYYKIL